MNRTALRRLARLEKRRAEDPSYGPFAHLSEEELIQLCKEEFDQCVAAGGIDELKSVMAAQFTPADWDTANAIGLKVARCVGGD